MGSLNTDPARADATLTRTRHAWVVCQHGGGLTGPVAGSISPSSRTRARRRRRWHGGTRWSRRELPTWEVVPEPLDRTHTESRGKRRTFSRPPYLEVGSSAGPAPLDPTAARQKVSHKSEGGGLTHGTIPAKLYFFSMHTGCSHGAHGNPRALIETLNAYTTCACVSFAPHGLYAIVHAACITPVP